MYKWVKVRRKVLRSKLYPGHGGSFGIASMRAFNHVWLECGHEKDLYGCVIPPKTTICPKCSYKIKALP